MSEFVTIIALLSLLILVDDALSAAPARESASGRQRVTPDLNRPISRCAAACPPMSPPAEPGIAGGRGARRAITVVMLLGAGGCTHVPVSKQAVVSQPNMIFHDRGAFVYGPRQNAQLEPGAAGSSGATAAGCTACK